jgi:hypothetical protein
MNIRLIRERQGGLGPSGLGPSHAVTDSWNETPNPARGHAISLNDVSCVTATASIAVGDFFRGLATLPLIERYL